jgi:hypothetical protein
MKETLLIYFLLKFMKHIKPQKDLKLISFVIWNTSKQSPKFAIFQGIFFEIVILKGRPRLNSNHS